MEYTTELFQKINQEKTKENPTMILDPTVLNHLPYQIPQEYVWSDDEKPSSDVPILQAPLINLGGFLSGDPILVSEATRLVSEAAVKHGFFQVTNHGVDEGLLSNAFTFMDTFFKSPMCEKQKIQMKMREGLGYSNYVGIYKKNVPWKEVLGLMFSPEDKNSQNVQDFITKRMGDGYKDFGRLYQDYAETMSNLSLNIMELIGMSLGVKKGHFKKIYEDNESTIRLNYYPKCKQPDVALGTGPHYDPTTLTILQQDHVSGLQVFVDNQWHSIPPNPQALVVNIGDTLMVLSNGRYKSCMHRSVVNSEMERKSIAFFLSPKGDKVVKPPEELDGKREYPEFTWSMFLEFVTKYYRPDRHTFEEFTNWLKNK